MMPPLLLSSFTGGGGDGASSRNNSSGEAFTIFSFNREPAVQMVCVCVQGGGGGGGSEMIKILNSFPQEILLENLPRDHGKLWPCC